MYLLHHLPSSGNGRPVCDGNGKFVAITDISSIAASSEGGINWTEIIMPSRDNWISVCYGNDKFVAVIMDPNYNA